MLLYKQKKSQVAKGNRLLISVTVLGSAGPIRFVVNEDELVATVIDSFLQSYDREDRLPVLGFDFNDFSLYCPTFGSGDPCAVPKPGEDKPVKNGNPPLPLPPPPPIGKTKAKGSGFWEGWYCSLSASFFIKPKHT
ncbi:hypothetical protein K2173_004019 [Erythroxylum novogranatense]|uniref:DUF7054 domain-containing protein n=1 Tax=Erythroxylum novogranatense TaxID=1862640 RepID=A0AAV8SJJ0_9ROSI|nr:hypothetical protein K2173_004019 [Erythroxylum novogranatense]